MNLLGDNIDTAKRKTETLTDACKEVGLELNTEKTNHMVLSIDRMHGKLWHEES
jgi:hypothetical protein